MDVPEARGRKGLRTENGELKRLLVGAMCDSAALAGLLQKMAVSAAKGEANVHLDLTHEMSEGRACSVIGCGWMRMRCQCRGSDDSKPHEFLVVLAQERRWFGHRRLLVFLRREGFVANHKRLFRIYREGRLTVRERGCCKRAFGARAPILIRALPNDLEVVNFVSDQLDSGRRFQILAIYNVCTHRFLTAIIDLSLFGKRVARELNTLIARDGKPKVAGSDKGTKLTSNANWSWPAETGIDRNCIDPGKPMATAFIESVNGRPRDEFVNETSLHRLSRRAWRLRSSVATITPYAHILSSVG